MRYLLFILTLALVVYSCDTSEPVEEDVLLSVSNIRCDIYSNVSIPGFHREYAEYHLTDPSINTIKVSFTYRSTQSNIIPLNAMGNTGINFQDTVWTTFMGRDSIYCSSGYQYQVTGLSYVLQNNNGVIPIFFELLLKQGLTSANYCEYLNIKVVKVN